jgi:hypothetical protein
MFWSTKANAIALQETVMKVTGGCPCGHITYKAEVDPARGLPLHGLPEAYRHGVSRRHREPAEYGLLARSVRGPIIDAD